MNEPDFEKHLRSVQPPAPRRSLEERIARELAPGSVTLASAEMQPSWLERILPALGWTALGAAAGVVAMLAMNLTRETGAPVSADVPSKLAAAADADVELEHQLLDVADEGIVEATENGPARLVRYQSLERRQWKEKDGAVTVVEVPREDIVLMPVAIQ